MSQDISDALSDWDFEPGSITVRKILGEDGREKVQMRVELGLIQMEMSGRPDGLSPQGRESYLHYYREQLQAFVEFHGDDTSYRLDAEACGYLKEESLHYYYRYLSLFHLRDFEQVARDTQRNLEVADFLKKYAERDEDRTSIEQYRAYILMMNSQARARIAALGSDYFGALGIVREGLRRIRQFLSQNLFTLDDETECPEIKLLEELEREILDDLPENSVERLRDELAKAIYGEEFEKAAGLRDRIREMEQGHSDASGDG